MTKLVEPNLFEHSLNEPELDLTTLQKEEITKMFHDACSEYTKQDDAEHIKKRRDVVLDSFKSQHGGIMDLVGILETKVTSVEERMSIKLIKDSSTIMRALIELLEW